jgi:16S rRNA (guanine(966)-N(2))-methyltransferase RsmD
MRIISGEYRGRILRSPVNLKTRPTSDRLRETLFNVINPLLTSETRFLDLCAGTGAIGIEALSRGARFATFVDKSRKSCGLIEKNLDLLKIPEEQTEVLCSSAEDFARRAAPDKKYDIIYFDPPYKNDYLEILREFGDTETKVLAEESLFIVEHHAKQILPDKLGELRRWRLLKQGESCLSFYERQ